MSPCLLYILELTADREVRSAGKGPVIGDDDDDDDRSSTTLVSFPVSQ